LSTRLLIVDDQEDIRLMLQILFEEQGWDTEQAMSGEVALARKDLRFRFDALVVDYRMPGLDGMQLARSLRETGFTRPIILCSAYLNPEVCREAEALGTRTVDKSDSTELVRAVRGEVAGAT
jgi:two-component system response regulator (stage 0 sporulation protein F)